MICSAANLFLMRMLVLFYSSNVSINLLEKHNILVLRECILIWMHFLFCKSVLSLNEIIDIDILVSFIYCSSMYYYFECDFIFILILA